MAGLRKQNIVILGAGPGGLCAAWNLAQDGHHVTVLEALPTYGGLSATFARGDYRYDLGPHNIHTSRKSIMDFLEKNLADSIFEHPLRPEIFYRKKRFVYPLQGEQVLRLLPIWTMIACGFSFLWSRIRAFVSPAFKDDGTYKTWVVNRFGQRFYDIFFGPYTEKTWGFPPSELSDIVAQKRIAVRGLSELINSVLFKKELAHPENPRLIRNLYPREGVGEISDFFAKGILESGGEILTSCKVEKITLEKGKATAVHYLANGTPKVIHFDHKNGFDKWDIISTIPINDMVLMLEGDVPSNVRDSAKGLDFSSMVLLFLDLDQPDAFGVELLYFSESEFLFNRIYDVGLFSRAMVPEGKNAICIEITCTQGDETWNMDEKALYEKCILSLEKHGFLERSKVSSYHIQRLTHAYPRFRVGYQQKLRAIVDYLKNVPNIITFGRQGLFSYANVDDVIWMAFEISKQIDYRDRITLPVEELLPDYINF